jgi:hypothetical protein
VISPAVRSIRPGPTAYEQLLVVGESNVASVGARGAILGLITVNDDLRALGQNSLGEAAAE